MSTSKREKTKQQLAFKRCVRCILSDILIDDVPEKYYLSQQQMERLLYKSRQEGKGNGSTKPKG